MLLRNVPVFVCLAFFFLVCGDLDWMIHESILDSLSLSGSHICHLGLDCSRLNLWHPQLKVLGREVPSKLDILKNSRWPKRWL